jgi:Hypoxia induced protein conserved region
MAAMAKKRDDDAPVLSEVEARAGVTGHHVRRVLAFGLAGSVIAFVVIALYFYYAKLIETISQASAAIDLTRLVYFAIPLALGSVAIVLVLGLWNMVARPRPEVSQTLMRWRVALQFIALCLVMAALYLSAKS